MRCADRVCVWCTGLGFSVVPITHMHLRTTEHDRLARVATARQRAARHELLLAAIKSHAGSGPARSRHADRAVLGPAGLEAQTVRAVRAPHRIARRRDADLGPDERVRMAV